MQGSKTDRQAGISTHRAVTEASSLIHNVNYRFK